MEVHRRGGAALRHRAKIRFIAEHFRERNHRGNDLRTGAREHSLDSSAPRVDVAGDRSMYSSGVTTSTFITGSSSAGLAALAAFLKAIEPAILNANSDESTSWKLPKTSRTLTSTIS